MDIAHRAGFGPPPASVYVDRLTAEGDGQRPTVVMLHGGGHTGSCYLITADGRPGWAYRFAARGYPVMTADWPGHGRSGAVDLRSLTGEAVCAGLAAMVKSLASPVVLVTHSMGGALGWRVAELCGEQVVAIAGIAPGPPGNIQDEPELVSETPGELVVRTPQRTVVLRDEGANIATHAFVTDKLIGASRQFPQDCLDAYAGMLTHTSSRLLYERQNVRGSQVRVQHPEAFAGKPILVVTGSDDLDHPRALDEGVAEWFAGHGAVTRFVWLPELGIDGNGHMLMMESNSDVVADVVINWLDQVTGEGMASPS